MKITFRWMGHDCTLDAPTEVATRVHDLLAAMARPTPAASVDVRVTRGSAGFEVSNGQMYVCTTAPEAVDASELAVVRRLLAVDRTHCHLHAAATVADTGDAVLALGASGSGKSTLAYQWCRSGRPVFGDDVVALDDEGRVHPFPRPLKVDAMWLREAGEAPEETVAWEDGNEEVWVDPTRGPGWAAGGAPVAVVGEIRFIAGAETRVEPVYGAERLRMLLNAMHVTGIPRERCLDRLVTLAERGTFSRIVYGSAEAAASELLRLAGRRRR